MWHLVAVSASCTLGQLSPFSSAHCRWLVAEIREVPLKSVPYSEIMFASLWYHLTYVSTSYIYYERKLTLEAGLYSSSFFLIVAARTLYRRYCELPITSYEEAHMSGCSTLIMLRVSEGSYGDSLTLPLSSLSASQLMVSTIDDFSLN